MTFGNIQPDAAYSYSEVAALFRRKKATVYDWIKAGKIVPMRNVRLILGSEILRFADLSEPPKKSETVHQRGRRGKSARAAIANA